MEPFSEMAKMGEEQFCGWLGQISKFHMGHFEFEVLLRHPGKSGNVKEAAGCESGARRKEMRTKLQMGHESGSHLCMARGIRERSEGKHSRQSLEICKVPPSLGILGYFLCSDTWPLQGSSLHTCSCFIFTFSETPLWFQRVQRSRWGQRTTVKISIGMKT